MNWYAYCSNNPVNFTDPSGLETLDGGFYLPPANEGKDQDEIEPEPEKPKVPESAPDDGMNGGEGEPDVNNDPWGIKKALNLDFGHDHMNDAAWFYSQGKIVRGLLSSTAGAMEAAYDLAGAYVAAEMLGVACIAGPSLIDTIKNFFTRTDMHDGVKRGISGSNRIFEAVEKLKEQGMSEEAAISYIGEMNARFGENIPTIERINALKSHMLKSKDIIENIIDDIPDIFITK